MSLVTPVLVLQLVSNVLITDHVADAYRNKYYQTVSQNESMRLLLPTTDSYFYSSIEGLTKWDAEYFLEISKDGYVSERHLAFLPVFPVVMSLVKQTLFDHKTVNLNHLVPYIRSQSPIDHLVSIKSLEDYIKTALVGVALNNFVLFPIACISLFALTRLVKNESERYAKNVLWWFCFNPASIFFSTCYSESLYAALTFTAIFMIEYRSQTYLSRHQNPTREQFVPLNHLNRLIFVTLLSLAPLALASGTRSNGLVNIGFIFYQFILKYITMVYSDRSSWSVLAYLSVSLEYIQDVLVLVMSAVIASSGYITFQIYSYIKFCSKNNYQKGTLSQKPDWCDDLIPHPYGQVQAKYWSVGFFRYYEIKQLPNFLLALPITYLVLVGSSQGTKNIAQNPYGKKQFPYYVQGIIMTIVCSISINIQVITRLLASSCPVIYWICADMAEKSRFKNRVLCTYFISYFIIGTILHCNFYPWT